MGEFRTYECNECGALKRHSNHWFILRTIEDAARLIIEPLDGKFPNHPVAGNEMTLCSKRCVMVNVERFMQRVMDRQS